MKAGILMLILVALIEGCTPAPVIIRSGTDTLYLPAAQDTLPITQDSVRPWIYAGSAKDSSLSLSIDTRAGEAVINRKVDTVYIPRTDTLFLTQKEKDQIIKNEFNLDKDFIWMLMGIGFAVYASIRFGIAKLTGKV